MSRLSERERAPGRSIVADTPAQPQRGSAAAKAIVLCADLV
ncbi:hypothetical protein [Gemmata algarum]|nr:hypothetical protein [Gemmata algarum]